MNFTFSALEQAKSEIQRLDDLAGSAGSRARGGRAECRLRQPDRDRGGASSGRRLADDLNVSSALGALFRLVREAHVAMDAGELPLGSRDGLREALARHGHAFWA